MTQNNQVFEGGGGIQSARIEDAVKRATSGHSIESPIPLLNCPFCGGQAALWQWVHPATPGFSVTVTHSIECSETWCVSTSHEVEAEWAIEIWNRRWSPTIATGSSAVSETVEAK